MPAAAVLATQADAPVVASAVNATTATKYYYFNGQRIAMKKGDVLSYLHGDHLGSTVLETGTSGAMTADQQYYAYGRQRDTGPVVTDHKFTGQKQDATGLLYYGARYYDPEIGQFISPDTLVPDPGNLFDYNRYLYTRGNPMQYTDPTGHQSCMAMAPAIPLVLGCQAGELAMRYGPTIMQLAVQWADKLPAVGDWLFSSNTADQGTHSAGQQNAGNTGDPGGLDPNNFDPDKGKNVVRSLQQLFNRYPLDSGKCSTCATKTYDVLKNAGYNAEIVRFEYGKNIVANAMLKANGEVIATSRGATTAYHEFVRVGDRVFDAMTGPAGMNWNDYLKLWDPDTLRLVTQVVV